MPDIKLTIDCGEELCRNCHFITRNPWNGKALSFCKLFHGKNLKQKGRGFVRCRECLDAEIEKVDQVERAIKNLEREETYRKRREERLKGITVKRCEKLHECDDCHYKNNCNVHKQMRDNQ